MQRNEAAGEEGSVRLLTIFRGKEQVQAQQITLVLSTCATSLFAFEYTHELILQIEQYVEGVA